MPWSSRRACTRCRVDATGEIEAAFFASRARGVCRTLGTEEEGSSDDDDDVAGRTGGDTERGGTRASCASAGGAGESRDAARLTLRCVAVRGVCAAVEAESEEQTRPVCDDAAGRAPIDVAEDTSL